MDLLMEIEFVGKIVIAALLGGIVGIERELAEKPAGLRTHMLVGALSALLVVLAAHMVSSFDQQNLVSTDPTRVLQAIVVGISFLGAGTILKYGPDDPRTVEGLATGASILSVSAIGIAVALDAFVLAAGAALLNLFINWGMLPFISRLRSRRK
jgi:putative Mg2+ transporter-C (MgtC) family protein